MGNFGGLDPSAVYSMNGAWFGIYKYENAYKVYAHHLYYGGYGDKTPVTGRQGDGSPISGLTINSLNSATLVGVMTEAQLKEFTSLPGVTRGTSLRANSSKNFGWVVNDAIGLMYFNSTIIRTIPKVENLQSFINDHPLVWEYFVKSKGDIISDY